MPEGQPHLSVISDWGALGCDAGKGDRAQDHATLRIRPQAICRRFGVTGELSRAPRGAEDKLQAAEFSHKLDHSKWAFSSARISRRLALEPRFLECSGACRHWGAALLQCRLRAPGSCACFSSPSPASSPLGPAPKLRRFGVEYP